MGTYFSNEFWGQFSSSMARWITTELPSIFVTVLVFLLLLKGLKIAINQFKKYILNRAEHDDNVDTLEAQKRINTLTSIIYASLKISLFIVFFIMILSKFGADIGPLLASAGILGLALGFGAQELVRDYISGFFMLLENQVRTGDVAIINGTGGLVESIELRTITLRDLSGVVHIFQNGKINTLANMTKTWSAMVFDIGVAYKENVDNVMKIMKDIGDEMYNEPAYKEIFIEPIEISGLNEFADSALMIRARIKTKPAQQWATGREYRRRLKMAFDKNGVEIPFPHTTVYWGEEINPLNLNVKQQN